MRVFGCSILGGYCCRTKKTHSMADFEHIDGPENEKLTKQRFERPAEANDPILGEIDRETGAVSTLNSTEILDDGRDFFAQLEHQIEHAEKSIHINVFIWSPDSTGKKIAEKIIEAKKANPKLEIDIHVDLLGSLLLGCKDSLKEQSGAIAWELPSLLYRHGLFHLSSKIPDLIKDPTQMYALPPEDQRKIEKLLGDIMTKDRLLRANPVLKILEPYLTIENNPLSQLDHSKLFAFDDTSIFTGGMNIGDEYSGGYERGEGWSGKIQKDYWKDYMIKTKGPATAVQRNIGFRKYDPIPANAAEPRLTSVRVLHNQPSSTPLQEPRQKQITFAMKSLIQNAKKEILLEHAYIMDQGMVDLLKEAAGRNVTVRIVRSAEQNKYTEGANERHFKQLEGIDGITIVGTARVLHTKLMVVDAKYALIGSANMTKESLHHHEELSLLIDHSPLIERLTTGIERQFEEELVAGE